MTAADYARIVRADLDAIEVRAMTLYALSDPAVPWPSAMQAIRDEFEERAARELWDEGALRLDPRLPYYEGAYQ